MRLLGLFVNLIIVIGLLHNTSVNAQMPAIPDIDSEIYYGQEYGASGIADALIKFIQSFPEDLITSKAFNQVQTTLEYVWENRIIYDGNPISSWSKGPSEEGIYPGKKYGAAGIIPTFLDMYNLTGNDIWLNRAISSYWRLSIEAKNGTDLPNWSYAYYEPREPGVSLTDLKYGSAGILAAGLDLFKVTRNQSYIDHGVLIVDWLKSVSVKQMVNGQEYLVMPWYNLDGTVGPIKSGYEWGIAGIAPQIYRLGLLVGSDPLKQWAMEMADYLVAIQNSDGSWFKDFSSNERMINFDEGSAGVVYGLYEMKLLSGRSDYDATIRVGAEFLLSMYNLIAESPCFCVLEDGGTYYNNINRGILGVIKSLNSVNSLLDSDQANTVKAILEQFLTKELYIIFDGNTKLLMMNYEIENKGLIDFSYGEGLAGLLSELIEYSTLSSLQSININITEAIISTVNTLLHFQNNDGYWSRQRNIPVLGTSKLELIDPAVSNSLPTITSPDKSTQSESIFQLNLAIFFLFVTLVISRRFIRLNQEKN